LIWAMQTRWRTHSRQWNVSRSTRNEPETLRDKPSTGKELRTNSIIYSLNGRLGALRNNSWNWKWPRRKNWTRCKRLVLREGALSLKSS
jgi:hypothetical protein